MITPELRHLKLAVARSEVRQTIRQLHELGVVHITETEDHDDLQQGKSLDDADAVSKALFTTQYMARVLDVSAEQLDSLPAQEASLKTASVLQDDILDTVEDLDEKLTAYQDRKEQLHEQQRILSRLPDTFNALDVEAVATHDSPLDVTAHHAAHDGMHYYAATSKPSAKELRESPAKQIDASFITTTPADAKQRITKEINDAEEDINEIHRRIQRLREENAADLSRVLAELEAHYEETTLPNKFQVSDDLAIIEGYCEPHHLDTVRHRLDHAVILEENPDEAPTKLSDTLFAQPFQTITSMFDTPQYGAADPTILVSLFFPLFFGFMLSDIGYGLILLATTAWLRTKNWEDTDKYANILGVSALATVAFGAIFGSFFGSLIPIDPLWADQFDASFTILLIALAIGLAHMNIAIVIDAYQRVKQGRPLGDIAKHVLPLPLAQAGALLLYNQAYISGATALIASTALLTARDGFIGVLGLSDYLGTWFSYARLLALNLATAGIALAVNIIASGAGSLQYIGPILYGVVLLVGHAFNYAVNLLGTTINAARLHYVEFFDLFFQGGGTKFTPFSYN